MQRLINYSFSATLVFLCLLTSPFLLAQSDLCDGQLGNNIFTSGDFGSGTQNIVSVNPNLAPGFQYTTIVPPSDGQYTLTNDIGNWSSVFVSWLQIGDNSPDPNGYMMVVNASNQPGIFYERMVDNVCENTEYVFSADVINLVMSQFTGHNLPNVSFLINDVEIYNTGPIAQDEVWHTYGFTFVSGAAQSTLKLTLRNNAPGGPGNDLAIDNINFQPCGPVASLDISTPGEICKESLFPVLSAHISADTFVMQWQISYDSGMVWTDIPGAIDTNYVVDILSTGQYHFRFIYSNTLANLANINCKIFSDVFVVDVVPIQFHVYDTICEGLTFEFDGQSYTQTGIYERHYTAVNGCDSIVIINLEVVDDPPIIAEFMTKPPSCIGKADGLISIVSVSGTRPPYKFFVSGAPVPSPITSVNVSAGTYTVRIENEYGCFDEQQLIIPDGPPLMISTISDTTIILGHSLQLEVETNIPIWMSNWFPAEWLNCGNCLEPVVTPEGDTTYTIIAETVAGCIDTASVTIRVDPDPVLYIPNIFTPNGDGINDIFLLTPDPLNIISVDELYIYDRWGGLLTSQANLSTETGVALWDGNTKWGPAVTGVYVFIVKFTSVNHIQRTVIGNVSLLR